MTKPDTKLSPARHVVNAFSWLLFNHRPVMLVLFALITGGGPGRRPICGWTLGSTR